MRFARNARWFLLALLLSVVPATSFAGVFISVGFAPPVLPVYEQPICPEPGMMWTPGYWAYGADGYYWVPGAWVPSPYVGALWTPGYWGFEGGNYLFHDGYWGRHIGYYGGVNYGFGYGGIGFAGGMWRGGFFSYNTVVMHVGRGGGWGGHVYEDRVVVERSYVVRDSHVAYAGGPGGIHHEPSREERVAEHEEHRPPSEIQQHHVEAARLDKTNYVKNNGGHPTNAAVSRPLTPSHTAGAHTTETPHAGATSHSPATGSTHTNAVASTHTNTAAPARTNTMAPAHANTAGSTHPNTMAPAHANTAGSTHPNTMAPAHANTAGSMHTNTAAPPRAMTARPAPPASHSMSAPRPVAPPHASAPAPRGGGGSAPQPHPSPSGHHK